MSSESNGKMISQEAPDIADNDGNLGFHRILSLEFSRSPPEDDMVILIERNLEALKHQNKNGDLPLHIECRSKCRSSIIEKLIELYPDALSIANAEKNLPLHILLANNSSTEEVALMIIERYQRGLSYGNKYGFLPIHYECKYRCRMSILTKCIELFPSGLSITDLEGYLPLHRLLANKSTVDVAIMMIMANHAALQQQNMKKLCHLPLHIECNYQCRSTIIAKCIELYPESLSGAEAKNKDLPLHRLLMNRSSSEDDALMMIEKYPEALKWQNDFGYLPLHVECKNQCRSSIITTYIKFYPEALSIATKDGYLPLHVLFSDRLVLSGNKESSMAIALMIIEKYPRALQHRSCRGSLPLHVECRNQRRSSIIAKCIELYPESLSIADGMGDLPLHVLFYDNNASKNESMYVNIALMMIKRNPALLRHRNTYGSIPLHTECRNLCRLAIIQKCIELYPESFDRDVVTLILKKVSKHNIPSYTSVLSMVFTALPMSLYEYDEIDIRRDPYFRRKILNLLPRHVFSQRHEADYADLNWKPRSAMLQLLAQIK